MQDSKSQSSSCRKEGMNKGLGWGHYWILLVSKCPIHSFTRSIRGGHVTMRKQVERRVSKTPGLPITASLPSLEEKWSSMGFPKILSGRKRNKSLKNLICIRMFWGLGNKGMSKGRETESAREKGGGQKREVQTQGKGQLLEKRPMREETTIQNTSQSKEMLCRVEKWSWNPSH